MLCAWRPAAVIAQAFETGFINRAVTVGSLSLPYQVYVPANYAEQDRWPVILFLHGAGVRGRDGLSQANTALSSAIRSDPARYPAIVIFPQAPPDSTWTGRPAEAALAALDAVLAEFRTDADRVYLTGLSMGGHGTWYLAYRQPDRFAALAPICGWVSDVRILRAYQPVVPDSSAAPFEALARKLSNVPIWIFHGEVDTTVPVSESRQAAAALRAVSANVRYTEFPGMNHNVWDSTYASHEFTTWLFAQRRRR